MRLLFSLITRAMKEQDAVPVIQLIQAAKALLGDIPWPNPYL